jgi:hypothetical protein
MGADPLAVWLLHFYTQIAPFNVSGSREEVVGLSWERHLTIAILFASLLGYDA